ncbi:hypothetical protein AGRA3207_003686 [Actinomadura graeca]|uniref:N-acetyltransferase domain-containing protein n=1 Tax=Actinomadura graeca TaxID=2750812 RepID=A0ABX8QV16_9ACTN|nr:hypothetical protein [Actinomadura graeca]QXJ22649.1 hypothetical protein AGRA3207_003686 [Actinomadura graeca]
MPTTFDFAQRSVRPYRPADEPEVLALINEDRLVGQPVCTWGMLEAARIGRSAFEGSRWARLGLVRTDVVVDEEDVVLGVVSTGVHRSDGTGTLLWLHGGEEPAVVHLLLDAAMRRLGGRTISAFPLLSSLGLGLRGLPAKARAATYSAMRGRAFEMVGISTYLHQHLTAPAPPPADVRVRPKQNTDFLGWRIHADGADAHIDVTVSPYDVGWVTHAEPDPACAEAEDLVRSALHVLTRCAAREVVATIPSTGAGAPDLHELYGRLGFAEVDRLTVLSRPASIAP